MKYLFALVFLLSGCASNLTLVPRGGGEVVKGTAQVDGTMEIHLKGQAYRGEYTRGQSTTIGTVNRFGAKPSFGTVTGTSMSNQYSAVLLGGSKAIRCEFTGSMGKGNGVCVDSDNVTYDMVITLQ